MSVKVEEISSVKKKLFFEIAPEQVDAEFDKAYQKVSRTAKIKGFRPGKIPRTLVEQYYGPQIQQQALERLINDTYFKALVDHRIPAITDPEIVESSPLEKSKSFTYEAQVEVKPELKAKDYTGLSLQKEKLEIGTKVIDDRLEELRQARAEIKVSPREEARDGDFLTIDFEGFVDGEGFAGGKGEGQVLELGSGTFIPGFEEQLVGMKREEEREIAVTFPEKYGSEELAGKPATFRVTVREIKEKTYPDLGDDFAREFGLESLDQLREKISENHRRQEESRIEGDLRERLIKALIERNPVEVPETMVVSQLDYMMGNIQRRLQSQGLGLEMMGMNEESFRRNYRDTAVAQVQGTLILEAVATQEGFKVDAGEIESKIEKIAELANAPLEAVKSYYSREEARRGLVPQILEEKTVQFLLEKSRIEEVDRSQLPGASKENKEQNG